MTGRVCTCRAPEPGWPQHTTWCGKPEDGGCRCDRDDTLAPDCPEHGHLLAEHLPERNTA